MAQFATKTTVTVEKSQSEIRSLLNKYGANQFIAGDDSDKGLSFIQFRAKERNIKFLLTLPQRSEQRFHFTAKRQRRSPQAAYLEWEQACRTMWRALVLCIKAKLEAVESGISEFEDEFMAHIVLPGGQTVSELMRPQIKMSYETGRVPDGIAGFIAHNPSEVNGA